MSPDAVRVPTPEDYTRMAWDARRRAWARIIAERDIREALTTATVTAAQRLLADLEPEPVELIAARRDALPGWFWQREAP